MKPFFPSWLPAGCRSGLRTGWLAEGAGPGTFYTGADPGVGLDPRSVAVVRAGGQALRLALE